MQGLQRIQHIVRLSRRRCTGALVLALVLGGCGNAPSAVDPHGPAAAQVTRLWWGLFAVATAVVVIVTALMVYGLFRSRRTHGALGDGRWFILIGGGLIPAVILIGVVVFTVGVQAALALPSKPAMTVEVIGHQYWWEVRYPDTGVVSANEIHIPVGQPVILKLTSQDVIHSVWVPQLQVKMDMIPGKTNTNWIQADDPGEYRGECTEFCGQQHAMMQFILVADPPEQFAAWLANEQQVAADPTDPLLIEGKQVFLGAACVYCHAVRGTDASGQIGPDLTHLASRRTIGAGVLENNRGNLSGWLINAQTTKPGNRMPPMYLDPDSLQALLAYMESLK